MKIFPHLPQTRTHKHSVSYLCLCAQFGCSAVIECAHKINTAGNDIPPLASSHHPCFSFASLRPFFFQKLTQPGLFFFFATPRQRTNKDCLVVITTASSPMHRLLTTKEQRGWRRRPCVVLPPFKGHSGRHSTVKGARRRTSS